MFTLSAACSAVSTCTSFPCLRIGVVPKLPLSLLQLAFPRLLLLFIASCSRPFFLLTFFPSFPRPLSTSQQRFGHQSTDKRNLFFCVCVLHSHLSPLSLSFQDTPLRSSAGCCRSFLVAPSDLLLYPVRLLVNKIRSFDILIFYTTR